jgi:hypothetical protein
MALSDKAKLYLKAGLANVEVGEEVAALIDSLEAQIVALEARVEALEEA